MSVERWKEVDRFFEQSFLEEDLVLEDVLARSARAGLPEHNVSPCQGRLLQIFALMTKSKRVLEIGTLGGYSTIWLARSIPENGQVVTVEYDVNHARTAEENLKKAGVADRVTLIQGDARRVLNRLITETTAPFDLVFIDADKPNNPAYLELSLELSHPGTIIIGDNIVREGEVANPNSADEKVVGVQMYCKQLKHHGLLSSGLQTVGVKGYDGFTISIVQ